MRYLIKAKEIYLADRVLHNTGVLVDRGTIVKVGTDREGGAEVIRLNNCKLIPGLIEMHIHGTNGLDVMDASYESLNGMSKHLIHQGVTSFLPTTVTSGFEKLERSLENVCRCMETGLEGARVIGSYVEGPYISKEYKGAHPETLIRDISIDEIRKLISISNKTIRIMTIAPEQAGSSDAIRYLKQQGVITSLGHSGATYKETLEAIDSGASVATHIFNGMRPLNHRETGILGAVLADERVMAEIICDRIHVDIPAIIIALKCKREELILISDSIMARGLPDGEYSLGNQKVYVNEGIAKTKEGSLAGSTLSLLNAIRTIVEKCGVSLNSAINFASLNPSRALGLNQKYGSIYKGKSADLVGIDEEYEPVFVMAGGQIRLLKYAQ